MPAPAKTPIAPAHALGIVAGVLERLPGALEEEALLRVDERGLARAEAEERRVELVDVVEDAARPARSRVAQRAGVDAGGAAAPRRVKKRIDSTPSRRFSQNCVEVAAPGKRPAMPTMAMASWASVRRRRGHDRAAGRRAAPSMARAAGGAVARVEHRGRPALARLQRVRGQRRTVGMRNRSMTETSRPSSAWRSRCAPARAAASGRRGRRSCRRRRPLDAAARRCQMAAMRRSSVGARGDERLVGLPVAVGRRQRPRGRPCRSASAAAPRAGRPPDGTM